MSPELRVLIVEDSAADAELLVRKLRLGGFAPESRRVDTQSAFEEALEAPWDLILSDYEMPGFDGLRALAIARERRGDVPFILVSGTVGEELAVAALREGAADYLLKDRLGRLGSAVSHALEQYRLRREQKRDEATLRENEERYQALIRTSMDGFCVVDRDGRLLEVSDHFCDLAGHPRERLLAMNVRDLESMDVPPPSLAEVAGRGWARYEGRHLRSDGRIVETEVSAVFLPGRGVFLRFVRDIGERKRLEAQLLRAQRLETVGRLAGGIAHDLNNILAPMLIGATLLRQNQTDPGACTLLDVIETSAKRGAGIIRQLMTFSRGAEGAREPVRLESFVHDMAVIMRETFPKNIVVRTHFDPDAAMVEADSTQVHQILMNLCVNARDAMPAGGTLTLSVDRAEVDASTVRTHPGAKPGPHVVLGVRDTGTGMPAEHLDRIFDPFFTTKPLGQGTGLGLSVVLGIVKSHGGFIQIDSRVGQGTEFRVLLPASAQSGPAPVPSAAAGLAPGREELILVVDDEERVRSVLRQALETARYRVAEAADGVEALTCYQARRGEVRMVISDVMMPTMDGTALLRAVRALDAGVPLVAITGAEQAARTGELQAIGVCAILPKPFTVEALLQVVQQGLAGSVIAPS